jgi:hypothetical protein
MLYKFHVLADYSKQKEFDSDNELLQENYNDVEPSQDSNSDGEALQDDCCDPESSHDNCSSNDLFQPSNFKSSASLDQVKKDRQLITGNCHLKVDKVVENSSHDAPYRAKKQCPFCGILVYHLPTHLTTKAHKWKPEKAQAALQQLKLRKEYTFRSSVTAARHKSRKSSSKTSDARPTKDYHRVRSCPVTGCFSMVKRMPPHLSTVHGPP